MEYLHSNLTRSILNCAYNVHNSLGPGLLESSYEACLFYELVKSNLEVKKQVGLPLVYDTIKLDVGYRIDLLVNKLVIIEVKSVDTLIPIHTAQVLTYLKLSDCRVGLLINFNVKLLKNGIKRLIV
ncbi:MAG: GxxExxY protein [Bacteroidales bacterium]|nr:GxxExxY protein [Bacteroidales bacterium]